MRVRSAPTASSRCRQLSLTSMSLPCRAGAEGIGEPGRARLDVGRLRVDRAAAGRCGRGPSGRAPIRREAALAEPSVASSVPSGRAASALTACRPPPETVLPASVAVEPPRTAASRVPSSATAMPPPGRQHSAVIGRSKRRDLARRTALKATKRRAVGEIQRAAVGARSSGSSNSAKTSASSRIWFGFSAPSNNGTVIAASPRPSRRSRNPPAPRSCAISPSAGRTARSSGRRSPACSCRSGCS